MTELTLPELGENIETVDVSSVLVAVGDVVRADDPVIEVETEKASLEVPVNCSGRIVELRVREGDKLRVGEVILVVETSAKESADSPAPLPEKSARSGSSLTSRSAGRRRTAG